MYSEKHAPGISAAACRFYMWIIRARFQKGKLQVQWDFHQIKDGSPRFSGAKSRLPDAVMAEVPLKLQPVDF